MKLPYVDDITEQSFDTAVIEASHRVPVLADFWAQWCGPCRTLGPLLERLAAEYDGKFLLAKIDADANGGLAQRFGVRGLPTVKIFRNGEIVDEFVGALPENQIRPLIDKHLPGPVDDLLAEARQLASGNPEAAIELLGRAVEFEPQKDRLWLALAGLYADTGAVDEATAALGHLPPALRVGEEARAIEARLQLADLAAPPQDDDPHAAKLSAAAEHLQAGRFGEGMALLGEILQADPDWRDGAAREAMLAAFTLPGIDEATVAHWRRRIASLIN